MIIVKIVNGCHFGFEQALEYREILCYPLYGVERLILFTLQDHFDVVQLLCIFRHMLFKSPSYFNSRWYTITLLRASVLKLTLLQLWSPQKLFSILC